MIKYALFPQVCALSVTGLGSHRTIGVMKRILFLLGIGFLGLAFFGAAFEVAARAMSRDLGWLPSIGEIWATLSPDGFQAFLDAGPWIGWQHMVGVPALVLFGVPAFILIIVFRNKDESPSAEHEASLFLFDELAKNARETIFENEGDDTAPSDHADLHPADPSFAQDLNASDVADEHDYLLGPLPRASKAKSVDIPEDERP